MQKILLVGCTGEIGSRLCLELLGKGYVVFGLRKSKHCEIKHINHSCTKIDLLNSNLRLDLKSIRPEILIYCAWITEPNIFWNSPTNKVWVDQSKKIINEFENIGGKYLVVMGTCAEYSWNNNDLLHEESLENPETEYGKSKIELLNWIRERSIPFLWPRIFFKFGLGETSGRLIPSLIDSILLGSKFCVQNSNDVRDFVYITDVVQVLCSLISQEELGIVNIGSGIALNIKSVSEKIAKLMNREDLLHFNFGIKTDSFVVSNPKKLLNLLPNLKWKDFDLAILETIEVRKEILKNFL